MIIFIPMHKGDRCGGKFPIEKSVHSNPVNPEKRYFLTSGIRNTDIPEEKNGRIESILLGKKTEENINTWLKKNISA